MSFGSIVASTIGFILEYVSVSFRFISLGFRFTANLSAGHVMTDLAISGSYFLSMCLLTLFGVTELVVGFFESGVLVVQVSVFVSLIGVYAECT